MEVDPLEIWVIAGLLVDEHGHNAVVVAKERAEKALEDDDMTGSSVWRAVMDAAEKYLEREATEHKKPH